MPCYVENSFMIRNSLFCVSFDVHWIFSLSDSDFGKNVIIFGAYMSSSVYADNKK